MAGAFVEATLNFGYEVWGLGKSQDIKRIQLKCYKQLLKSKLLVWVYMVN